MRRQTTRTSAIEILALLMVIAFPLWAIIWVVMSANSSSNGSAAPVSGASAQPVQAATPQAPVGAPAAVSLVLDAPGSIPRTLTAGATIPFSFRIANTGTAATAYSYRVYVAWHGGEEDTIDVNSVSLSPGASTDISESLKIESVSLTGQVYIEIETPFKSIHFALPRA
jgi:hypothetical protein